MEFRSELVRMVRTQRTGWWGLVATALGDEEARQESMAGLSCEALTAAFEGPAGSPSIVEHRVQAVAASNPEDLVGLSRRWKPMGHIGQSLMDPEVDFWTAAWLTSLRFLKNLNEVKGVPVGALPRPLAREFGVLFRPVAPVRLSSWEAACSHVQAMEDYDSIRQLDISEVLFDEQIGEPELIRLLRRSGSDEPQLERLRFFFRRGQLIGEDGRRFLEQLVDTHWESLHQPGTTPSGFTVLVDLVLELRKQEAVVGVYERILSSLRAQKSPERLLPIVYLTAGRDWRHP